MARKTTVDLTEYSQKIKDRLVEVYGLRNMLSASLALFDAIESADRERLISIISSGSDAAIKAVVDELCAAYNAGARRRIPARKRGAVG